MPRSTKALDLIDRLATEEAGFLGCEFLAPMARGGEARVRLNRVACRFRVLPEEFTGFGVFAPVSYREAVLARPATLAERQAYLRLLPLVRAILIEPRGGRWLAVPAHEADARFPANAQFPVELVEERQRFETIHARSDGMRLWFDRVDPRGDPITAALMRESFERSVSPEALRRRGLTAAQRRAYRLACGVTRESNEAAAGADFWSAPWLAEAPESSPVEATAESRAIETGRMGDRVARRLRATLAHSGGVLIDYQERGDGYRVTYEVDGERFVSAVAKDDLTVYSAGVCLSGEDQRFDLNSLVGVLREGADRRALVPMPRESTQ